MRPCCEGMVKLDLSHNFLGTGVQLLLEAVRTLKQLRWLSLKDNCIDDDVGKALALLLKEMPALLLLDVSDNMLRNSGRQLTAALRHNTTLTKLNLRANFLSDSTGMLLLVAMKTNTTLLSLDLRGNILLESTLTRLQALLVRRRKLLQVERQQTKIRNAVKTAVSSVVKLSRTPGARARRTVSRSLLATENNKVSSFAKGKGKAVQTVSLGPAAVLPGRKTDIFSRKPCSPSGPTTASQARLWPKALKNTLPASPLGEFGFQKKQTKKLAPKALRSSIDRLSRPARHPVTLSPKIKRNKTEKEIQERAEIYALNAIMQYWNNSLMEKFEQRQKMMGDTSAITTEKNDREEQTAVGCV